ncbi:MULTISPECIES: hypothetical protein [unclassified Streptomyces]|uniref:hypothetical protein n=1 Tax=unclassified Streptomyces TaxID=2593676 RepID=UPI0036E0A009
MSPFISTRRHEQAMAGLRAEVEKLTAERDAALKKLAKAEADRDESLARQAAMEATRRARAAQRLDLGVTGVDDDSRDAELIRQWEDRVKVRDAWTPPTDPECLPAEGGSGRPTHPAVELRQALARCSALEALLSAAEGRKRPVTL